MKEKIERELREAVVKASDAVPGTKAPFVYALRNGSRSVTGKFAHTLDRLDKEGLSIVGLILPLAVSVGLIDDEKAA